MKRKSEKFYVKRFNFFKESWIYILSAFWIFLGFFIFGFLFPIFFEKEIFEIMKEMIGSLEGLNLFQTILFIFLNNLKASFVAMIFGIFFGIVPVLIATVNGYLAGFVSRIATREGGVGVLWRLLPHGFFEIPAIIFSIGIGMKIGFSLFGKKPFDKLNKELNESILFFVSVVIPLLVVAAIIESILIYFVK